MTLEGYSNIELLIDSGRTRIYRANQLETGSSLLLKTPGPEMPLHQAKLIYDSEFRIGELLDSNLHISYLGYENSKGRPVLFVEDFGAVALEEIIPEKGFEIDIFFNLAIQLAEALAQLHEKKIIHKDISSSNIVVNPETGALKLIDFGSASHFIKELGDSKQVTQANLAFISPEQTGNVNRTVTYKTDFYSLGITFFHMLTGRLPFSGSDSSELIFQHIAAEPPHVREIKPSILSQIDEIVIRLMNKNPDERYNSALGLLSDLEKSIGYWKETKAIPLFDLCQNDVSEVFYIPEQLFGREKELSDIKKYLNRVLEGQFTVTYILGASGIGKSAFVSELFKDIVKEKGNFGSGKFDQLQRNVPYSALIQALNRVIQNILIESEESIANWKRILHENLGNNAGLLATVIPDIQLIMGEIQTVELTDPSLARNRFVLAFKNLIKSFSQKHAPLVLFLDDLQWIDSATLQLFTDFFNSIEPLEKNYTFIIGAYRDGEVGADHPLSVVLRDFENRGFPKREIVLGPLREEAINEMCSEALGRDPGETTELVSLIYSKTRGSPFFVKQFLENIYDKGFIYLDREKRYWAWHFDKVQEADFTNNVVDLIQEKLLRLPEETKTVLKIAACLGNEFQASDIVAISDIEEGIVNDALGVAMNEDIVFKLFSNADALYSFQHDRIQNAAYELIDAGQLDLLHYKIGRYLIQHLDPSELNAEKLFEALSHLNRVEFLVEEPGLRLKLAHYNLKGATTAQQSNAYQAALFLADKGIQFLPQNPWSTEPDLIKDLHLVGSQSAYLTGEYAKMHLLVDHALKYLGDPVQKAFFYEIVVYSYASRREWNKAVEETLRGLTLLGLRLPQNPKTIHVLKHLGLLFATMGRRKPEDLLELPVMDNPRVEAIFKLFISAASAAYLTNQNMFAIFFTEMVRLSSKHGNGRHSAFAYVAFGVFYGGALGFINYGYRFGELGKKVFEKYPSDELLAKVYFSLYAFIQNWKIDVKDLYPKLLEGFQVGSQVGEKEYAAWCLSIRAGMCTLSGENLQQVESDLVSAVKFSKNLKQIEIIAMGFLDYTQWWLDKGPPEMDPLAEGFIDSKAPMFIEENFWTALAEHDMIVGSMYFYFFDYQKAWKYLSRGWEHHESLMGLFYYAQLAFYRAWCAIKLQQENPEYFSHRELKKIISDFMKWGVHSPPNHGHKIVMLEAEQAVLRGDKLAAIELFDKAIEQAANTDHPNDQGLFCEMTARHYAEWGKEQFGEIYLDQAYTAYTRWGAIRKMRSLEENSPKIGNRRTSSLRARRSGESTITEDILSALDVESIIKASQAISGETQIDSLLARLLKVLSESAGAQRVVILLKKDEKLWVQVLKEIGTEMQIINASFEKYDGLPRSLINYIEKTKKTVVLQNADESELFSRDPYFVKNKVKSVLGIPIIRQANLSGIIYLDNHLASGVFTDSRVGVLSALSTQTAISLENANFINSMKELNKSYNRFVPKEFLKMLNRASVLDVKPGDQKIEEMIILFADIRNFTSLCETIPANETFTLLNKYLTSVTPAIHKNGGLIDKFMGDGIIALFPNDADRALRAAVEMREMLNEFNTIQSSDGGTEVLIGIGMHIGKVILGSVGTDDRLSTTVIGDPVNVAARLESFTKINKTDIQVSGELVVRIKEPGNFHLREVGYLEAKGKSNKIRLFEEYSGKPPMIIEEINAHKSSFELGIEYFDKGDYILARKQFETYLEAVPSDEVAQYFLEKSGVTEYN